jgi:hypothetical protein
MATMPRSFGVAQKKKYVWRIPAKADHLVGRPFKSCKQWQAQNLRLRMARRHMVQALAVTDANENSRLVGVFGKSITVAILVTRSAQ